MLNITPKVQINFYTEYCKTKQTIVTDILMKTKALRGQFPNKSRVRDKISFILHLDFPSLIRLISLTCASNMCLILQSISDTIWHPLTKNLTRYKALLFGFNLFMELYTLNHRMFLCDIVIHTEHPCEDWLEPL